MRLKKDINIQIGTNIQTVREQAHYTQERLAEVLGISPNHLSAIERGASGASLEIIQKLCILLGISSDYLFFGEQKADTATDAIARQLNQVPPEVKPHLHKVITELLEIISLQNEK